MALHLLAQHGRFWCVIMRAPQVRASNCFDVQHCFVQVSMAARYVQENIFARMAKASNESLTRRGRVRQ